VPFEELQELWQSQRAPLLFSLDVRGVPEQLRRFGRNQAWINSFKLCLISYMSISLVAIRHWAPLAICGGLLFLGGLLLYLVLDWRNQIGLSRMDFSAPSVEFVQRAHQRLQQQLNPMRRLFWVFELSIGGGLILLLLSQPAHHRIGDYIGAAALPFVAYVLGERIRRFRFRRECGAVLEKVESLLKTMESQA
jgi:hypothetical protein